MTKYLIVGIGGAVGSILRFWAGGYVGGRLGARFPYGTFVINMTASFLIGFIMSLWPKGDPSRLSIHFGHQEALVVAQRAGLRYGETPQIIEASSFICPDEQVPDTSWEMGT